MKKIYISIETTGLDYLLDDIYRLSYVIEINGVRKLSKTLHIARRFDKVNDYVKGVLRENGISRKKFESASSSEVQFNEFLLDLKKFTGKGKNDKLIVTCFDADFTLQFLKAFFDENANPYIFSYIFNDFLDVRILANYLFSSVRHKISLFNLKKMLSLFNIPYSYDNKLECIINLEKGLFNYITIRLPN